MQPLEKAEPDDIHLEEPGHGATEDLEPARALPFLVELRRSPLAVDLDLSPVLAEGAERVVLEGMPQDRQRPREIDLGVHLPVLIARHVPAEQADDAIRPPAAALHPPPQEMIGPQDPVAIVTRPLRQEGEDLVAQPGRDALVGVDQQDPGVPRLRDGPVLLPGRVDVFVLQDPRAALPRDRDGGVGGKGIDHEDLVREADRLETVAQRRFLVEGRHDDGEPRPLRTHPLGSLRPSFCCVLS